MINMKRAVAFLPLYLAWAVGLDYLFDSASHDSNRFVPTWIVVGFVASALFVAVVSMRYLVRWARGAIPAQRHHLYVAILIAIVLSGLATDVLKGIAALLVGGHPWWVLLPIYTLGYVTCWAVLVFVTKAMAGRTSSKQD